MPRVTLRWRAVQQVLAGVPGDLSLRSLSVTARWLIVAAVTTANIVGAAIVTALILVVLPLPEEAKDRAALGLVVSLVYVSAALTYGTVRGLRLARPVIVAFEHERAPTSEERSAVLRLPQTITLVQAQLWAVAAVLFG